MLLEKLKSKSLILASQSPRRQELLSAMGLDFSVILKPIDETFPEELSPKEIAEHIAKNKASVFKNEVKSNEIVITGDTIVCNKNQILGKPKDEDDAYKMIADLSGTSHQVISSICLLTQEKLITQSDTAIVHFKELTTKEIEYYIENFKPFDKAGAYGIQEWLGHIGIIRLEGSFNTVMGLPTHLLYQMLMQLADN
tara:strand:+ start:2460 stop:3050 length:591 start_codon:yes stop_codon:yes gene_type:complete